jgi:hypothetical protein
VPSVNFSLMSTREGRKGVRGDMQRKAAMSRLGRADRRQEDRERVGLDQVYCCGEYGSYGLTLLRRRSSKSYNSGRARFHDQIFGVRPGAVLSWRGGSLL